MSVIEILLPLVIIVAAGFVTTKLRFFSDKFIGDISKFVLYFALPSVIFSGLTQMEMTDIIQPNFMLVYAMAGVVVYGNRNLDYSRLDETVLARFVCKCTGKWNAK